MKKNLPALPHILAILIFAVITGIYFAPQFRGYSLFQSDIQQATGMSKEIADYRELESTEVLWTNSLFSGMPAYQVSTKYSNLVSDPVNFLFFKVIRNPMGSLLLAMLSFYVLMLCFGVSPWLAIVGSVAFGFSSINILYLAAGHNSKVHAIALLPGLLGSLYYTYRKNQRIGALLFALFLCLEIGCNHIQELYYFLFLILALVILEGYKAWKEKEVKPFFQKSLLLLAAALIGALPNTSNLLATNEYGKHTIRGASELTIPSKSNFVSSDANGLGADYIKQYSMGDGEPWSIAIPNVKGGASGRLGNAPTHLQNVDPQYRDFVAQSNSYWGEEYFTGGAFYFGAGICLLFVLGIIFLKDPVKWAFLGIAILSVLLSWKYSVVLDWFIAHVPLFNKFRATTMVLVLPQLFFPLVAILFVHELLKAPLHPRKLNYALGAVLGLLLLFYMMPSVWFSFFSREELSSFEQQIREQPQSITQLEEVKQNIEQVRMSIFKEEVLRSLVYMLIVAVLIVLANRRKLAVKLLIPALGLVILADLWQVDKRYLNNATQERHWVKSYEKKMPFHPSEADRQILAMETENNRPLSAKIRDGIEQYYHAEDLEPQLRELKRENLAYTLLNMSTNYRVLTLNDPFSNASVSYYHKSIGGYHGAKLKRYQELIEFRLSQEYDSLVKAIRSQKDSIVQEAFRYHTPTLNMLNTKYIIYNPEAAPIRNPYAMGNAWYVKEARIVDSANDEILALNEINPQTTAIVDQRYSKDLNLNFVYDPMATIQMTAYHPTHLTYESSARNEQLALFSEMYYKDGWKVYIDQQPAPYFRANYVLRAMMIPAGHHTIEFRFEPTTFVLGEKISIAGSFALLAFAAGLLYTEHRARKKTNALTNGQAQTQRKKEKFVDL